MNEKQSMSSKQGLQSRGKSGDKSTISKSMIS